MTDRELLINAAKAARMTFRDVPNRGTGAILGIDWDPLADDGDALRLAVKLEISLAMNQPVGGVEAWYGKNGFFTREKFNDKCDATVATRRAIVRAAAEIGKAMP